MNADNVRLIKNDRNRIIPELARVLKKWDLEKEENKVLFVQLYINSRFNDFDYLRTETGPKGALDADHIGWFDGSIQLAKIEGGKALAEPKADSYYEEQAAAIVDAIE